MDSPTLPFTAKFQSGLLYLLLHDYDFLRMVIEELDAKHFDAGEAHIKLFKMISQIWKSLKAPVTEDIVKNTLHKLSQSGALSAGMVFGIESILEMGANTSISERTYIKENCLDFVRKQTIALAFGKAISFFETNDYDTMYSIMGTAYKKSFNLGSTLGSEYFKQSVFDLYSQPPRLGVWSSGFPSLDGYISGGFAKKESCSILSPTGRGKTALLCNLAASALKQGLNVSFVTLEMSENIIQQRTDAILTGASIDMISRNIELQQEVLKYRTKLSSRGASYVVKWFPRGNLSVEGLATYYDKYAMDYGRYPDVAIVDWLGCMKLPGSTDKKHEALGEIADGLINLAVANSMSMITAQQTNRSAVGSDTFGYDSVSASFESLFGMDLVLALGASDKAKDAGKRTLGLLKNRFGPDSVTVPLLGNRPNEVMNFQFEEAPSETEEADLITPE